MNISVHISVWAVRASNRDTALALGTWLLAFVRTSVRDARAPALESQERQEQQFKQNPYNLAHDVARLAAVFASMILPSLIAYPLACWQADREYRVGGWRRTTVEAHLTDVFADRFSEEERRRLTREYLRLRNCDDVDVRKLAGRRGTFRPLMEIRGLEHLQRALDDGHGALILAAHCGPFAAATARLGAEGLPVSVTRLPFGDESLTPELSEPERMRRRLIYQRGMRRYMRETIITGDSVFAAGVQSARRLRKNEIVISFSDAPSMPGDQGKTLRAPFLGHMTRTPAGAFTIAQQVGAPMFMMLVHRSPDYCHSILELSPLSAAKESLETVHARCLQVVENAILARPAEWLFWPFAHYLQAFDLLPADEDEPGMAPDEQTSDSGTFAAG